MKRKRKPQPKEHKVSVTPELYAAVQAFAHELAPWKISQRKVFAFLIRYALAKRPGWGEYRQVLDSTGTFD